MDETYMKKLFTSDESDFQIMTYSAWKKEQEEYKMQHPFKYWFKNDLMSFFYTVIYFIPNIIRDLIYYLKCRYIIQTHKLTSTLKPGTWYDLDTRMLHCLFKELENFVEIELAWKYLIFYPEEVKTKVPWHAKGVFNLHIWRSPELGLLALEQEIDDISDYIPIQQKETSAKTRELYFWWKDVQKKLDSRTYLDDVEDSNFYEECTEKLIELIKIRRSLWV
jgi:hypothetical protein